MGDKIKGIRRGSGILLHITSLPGFSGSGTLGKEVAHFVSFLKESGQSCWQILPLGPVLREYGYSPYASPSAFAGNEWFVSLEELASEGLLDERAVPFSAAGDFVRFEELQPLRSQLLHEAASCFFQSKKDGEKPFREFYAANRFWLDDFALFMALAEEFGTFHWPAWDRELAFRRSRAMAAASRKFQERIRFVQFIQFCFFHQWQKVKALCRQQGISIIGDIPYYVSMDGADTWSHPEIFSLAPDTLEPLEVGGVPPDYFSSDGQRWGNPLYLWFTDDDRTLNEQAFLWWQRRVHHSLNLLDFLRIDHFRGFEAYWAIPVACPTAREGRWVKGPGKPFFQRLRREITTLPLIAEDLGMITPEVEEMRNELGFPGMKVLQFAFDGKPDNPYLPHNYSHDLCLVYTGTHDNNTTNGWFYGTEIDEHTRQYILDYIGTGNRDRFHWQLIRLALQAIARLSIFPMQDILGYGAEFRMNVPGRAEGNWRWMLKPNAWDKQTASQLHYLTRLYNRLGE